MNKMPETDLLKKAYSHLFYSGRSLSKIRDDALTDRLFPTPVTDFAVPGRSIAWRLFLCHGEPLQSTSMMDPVMLRDVLRTSRQEYSDLLSDKMKAPDGSNGEGFVTSVSHTPSSRTVNATGNLEKNNPLSLHSDNPWKEWFASQELRKTILQDVERTFPDMPYFRQPDVQVQLTNILFLYSSMNPSIGYRQGMHELLAPLYYAIEFDAVADESSIDDSTILEICSKDYTAADAWALFEAVMRGVSQWYEWRESPRQRTSSSPFANHVNLHVSEAQLGLEYVAPIVQACNSIQNVLLHSVDPVLYKHMQSTGIEPQMYGIRWLRLLFTREFSMYDCMILWDGLFACDPTFELAQWVCVAMLIRIRNHLLPADYSGQLAALLRYPSIPKTSSDFNHNPHHATLLLRQALALQMAPTPNTGVSIVLENRNLLDLSVEVPAISSVTSPRRSSHFGRDRATSPDAPATGGSRSVHVRHHSSQHMGLPETIARGLMERGESLGINRTLMNAVSELRRNIPDLAASFVRSSATPGTGYTDYPLNEERPPEERPPWEPRTRFEMERDIVELRLINKKLGESVSWIVDTLLQDDSDIQDPERCKNIQNKKREALESLSYVRDVLLGNVDELEEDRLLSEDEVHKRKMGLHQEADQITSYVNAAVDLPQPLAPAPVPVVDSRPKFSSSRSYNSRTTRSPPHPPVPPLPTTSTIRSNFTRLSNTPLTSDTSSTRLAPWNYTKSNFSSTTAFPVGALPRPPPPTSTSLPHVSDGLSAGRRTADQLPLQGDTGRHDPLGVLK